MSISTAQASVGFLSGADDLLSRLLLDYSIFEEPRLNGRATGKINKHGRELRMTDSEVERAKALVRDLRSGSVSLTQGLETLLDFPSVDSFTKKWDDAPLFANHARRYILAFHPDCGIAFHETDRYKNPRSGVSARAKKNLAAVTSRRDPASFIEVGVFATRDFKKGELINLRGGIADLTEEEDDELRLSGGRSDFSVLWSERKNCFCLLLGPARFVNHDCRNNVEFNLTGANMSFKALEDIKKDEELFTHYGAHYFETDNAACLCATCEQLKQGAFTPASKRRKVEADTPEPPSPASSAVTRPRRNSSPGPAPPRSSARASRLPAVNYDESAPVASTSASAVLARRAVAKPTALTRSSSVGSAKGRPRPPSSRTMPVRGALSEIDALRGKPRLVVQPKLAPPPGYRKHYAWDPKQRSAKYTGPQVCKDEVDKKKNVKPAPLKLSRSDSNLGAKRRRVDSDSPAPTPSPRSRSKPASAAPPPRRIRPTSQVRLIKARLGTRRSTRLSTGDGTASARDKAFTRLQKSLGEGDSSDLSDGETSDSTEEEASEDEEDEDEAEAEAEEQGATSKLDKGKGKAVEPREDDVEMERVDRTASPAPFALPRTRGRRSIEATLHTHPAETPASSTSGNAHLRTVTLDLGFSTSTPIEEGPAPFAHAHGSEDEGDSERDKIELCPVPVPEPDKDDPRPPDRPRRSISTPNFYSNSNSSANARQKAGPRGAAGGNGAATGGNENSNSKSGESSFCEAPSSAGSSGRGSYSQASTGAPNGGGRIPSGRNGGGAGSGGDDEDERNGRSRNVPSDKVTDGEGESERGEDDEEEDRKPIIPDEASEEIRPRQDSEAIAALLVLNTVPDSESATPPPPSASASASASTSSKASSSHQGFEHRSNIRQGKRPAQESPRTEQNSSRSNDDPQTHAVEDEPGPSIIYAPPKPKKARIASPLTSESSEEPAPRIRKNIRWGKGKPAPSPPVVTGRQTRSKPIPGRLEDVLSAPETLAATGGYDWEKGRYITRHEQLRAPSSNPRPERLESESPSPPPSPRRRQRPSSAIAVPPKRASPVASTSSAPPPATKSRRSDSPVIRKPASRRRVTHSPVASTPQATLPPPVVTASGPPPEGRRATRRSFPIAGGLRDVIYSSSALAATGGWDEESGRYVGASSNPVVDDGASSSASSATPRPRSSTSNLKRSKSSTPRSAPAPEQSAPSQTNGTPDSVTRSTRRSNPINQRLEQLVYSSAIGGWDPEKGKYVSQVAARKAAGTK
ncbi:hypothetical protein JCM11491_006627 [Sporobolomyces phaffii]